MRQMTATARPLRVSRRGPAPAPLRALPSTLGQTGSGRFATICVLLLTVGLITLLLLNTALAKGALTLGALQRESAVLSDTAGNLQEEIDRVSSSGELARRASALGMVRSNERAYIDLRAGTVTGTAHPATRFQAFPIVTSPTPPPSAPKRVSTATATAVRAAAAAALPAAAAAPTGAATAAPTTAPTTAPAPSGTASPAPSTQVPATATAQSSPAAPTPTGTR